MIARIIIPQTPKWKDHRAYYHQRIISEWGGYTSVVGAGGWKTPQGGVVREPITIIDVYVPADTRLNREWWVTFANEVRVDLDQGCVYLQFSQADVQFIGEEDPPPQVEKEGCSPHDVYNTWLAHSKKIENNGDQAHHDIGGES